MTRGEASCDIRLESVVSNILTPGTKRKAYALSQLWRNMRKQRRLFLCQIERAYFLPFLHFKLGLSYQICSMP